MFNSSPEDLKNALVDIYTNNYPSFITQVQARHSTDPITIENFKDIFTGDATRTKEIKAWPSLAITTGDVISIQVTEQQRHVFWQTQIYVRYFLRHANISILGKLLDRHLEATMLMFEEPPYRTINGKVDSFEFLRAEVTDSILALGPTSYVKGLEVQWEARHR